MSLIRWAIILLIKPQILGGGGLVSKKLMAGGLMLVLVALGIQFLAICIGFFIAIARVIVNDDGRESTDPDPLVWCSGAKCKRQKINEAVRDFAMLSEPQRLWAGRWQNWPGLSQLEFWSNSLPSWVPFLGLVRLLIWALVESLLLSLSSCMKKWAGERLRVEDSVPKYRRPGRPISVSAAPLCSDVDIWKLCQYFGSMMRALRGCPAI